MRASSRAPTRPRVRSESTRWIVTMSAWRAARPWLDAPRRRARRARSAVRFWLQAIDVHAERLPDRGDAARRAGRARPRRACAPARSGPTVCCQPPARTAASSSRDVPRDGEDQRPGELGRSRCGLPPVPQTTMPWSLRRARRRSTALRGPVVTSSRRFGSRSRTLARERACARAWRRRRRTARSRATSASWSATWSWNVDDLDAALGQPRPVGVGGRRRPGSRRARRCAASTRSTTAISLRRAAVG